MADEKVDLRDFQGQSFKKHLDYGDIFDDGYCHDNLINFSIHGDTKSNSAFNYSAQVDVKKLKEGQFEKTFNDRINFQVNLNDNKIINEYKFKRDGQSKWQLDIPLDEKQYYFKNFFAKVATNKYTTTKLQAGFTYQTEDLISTIKLEKDIHNRPHLVNKSIFNFPKYDIKSGLVLRLNLLNKQLYKYDFFLNYTRDKIDASIQHISEHTRESGYGVGRVLVNTLYQLDKQTLVGVQASESFKESDSRVATLGLKHQLNDQVVLGAKADSNKEVSVSANYKVNDQLDITASALAYSAQEQDSGNLLKVPFGIQFSYQI